ncbi:MAG TPA: hypothetical protein VM509_12190, partial [Planctomycetota bacterium]|nr:hypothetical protein [Planctomycetota bacterium]
ARSLGKPALVLVTDPKDFYPRPDRATVFAQFLFDGGDEFWSDLALCEPACASHEEIRAVLPTAKLEGQPYFLLVEHDSGGPLVEVLQVKSPGPFDPESKPKAQRLALKADLEGWRSKLHEALAGDVPTLERRAEAARVALGPTAVSRVEALIQSGETVSDATLAGAAALFVLHARAHPDLGGKNKPLLEQQTRLRVMQDGLSGAGWGEHVSCNDPYLRRHGKVVSGPRVGIACGMGSLGPFGKRFLWYYTDERH